jgi:hypothetical protein
MKAMLPANPIVLFESNHTSTNLKRGKSLLSRTAGRTSSGSAVTSNSSDLAESDTSGLRPKDMTPDCLRAMTVPSLPADFLQLRVGAPLLLMGNLDPQHGLCNGTMLVLLRAGRDQVGHKPLVAESDNKANPQQM